MLQLGLTQQLPKDAGCDVVIHLKVKGKKVNELGSAGCGVVFCFCIVRCLSGVGFLAVVLFDVYHCPIYSNYTLKLPKT